MILVGITGDIGHGKTTLAECLAEQTTQSGHWESWQVIAEIAGVLRATEVSYPAAGDLPAINEWLEPLPAAVHAVVHRDIPFESVRLTPERVKTHPEHYRKLFEHLDQVHDNPDWQRTEITADNKENFRPILQWLGGFLIEKSDAGLWYTEILRRIDNQRNELELATIGGVRYPLEADLIRDDRGKVLRIFRPDVSSRDSNDLTERQGDQIVVDAEVINDGTLPQLRSCSAQVYKDLAAKALKPRYIASTF